jgi:hypothetical protein
MGGYKLSKLQAGFLVSSVRKHQCGKGAPHIAWLVSTTIWSIWLLIAALRMKELAK